MQGKLRIRLRERGSPEVISRVEWARSNCGADANELARIGVVKIQQSGEYLLLEPKTLVGLFDSPRLRVEVLAKSPDLASDLLRRLDGWRKRLDVDDPSSPGKTTDGISFWSTFNYRLSGVHQEGLPWKYSNVKRVTSAPRGRINFRETISKHVAKGITHKVAASQKIRHHFASFAPALDAVRRRISFLEAGHPALRSRVARLIDLSGDVSIPVDDRDAMDAFEQLSELDGRPALLGLCAFCKQVLLDGNHIRISHRIGSGVAEFVDMEKLWESAVQMLFIQHHHSTQDQVALHPLREKEKKLTLFDDGGPEIDPDIVVYKKAKAVAVIDAKYSVAASPSADDVYQLSSYVWRMKCDIGVLAYVAADDETTIKKIGTLDDGRGLFACYLSLRAFDPSERILAGLLLPERLPLEVT